MPSPFAHALFGGSLWAAMHSADAPRRTWIAGATLAVLPDADFVGFVLGVPYETIWGHRGITHSVVFALAAATFTWGILRRKHHQEMPRFLWLYLVLAALSHGVLDALTDGGLGVAFFAPFDNTRYFFAFRPILVSPLSLERFLTYRGLLIIRNEAVWVGVPSLLLLSVGWLRERSAHAAKKSGAGMAPAPEDC